ncbi:violaxanthin de-epoxidase-related [Quillaja saponaria]|uniref:Violaxanthin de-epoxidase-related n=1 Tax=Quillaja saponaria TaxID=32244 RepID=A0AAD7LEX3_QUISA|nr:violaxanthin de-epoxidase-related [Quillaja saponaria]
MALEAPPLLNPVHKTGLLHDRFAFSATCFQPLQYRRKTAHFLSIRPLHSRKTTFRPLTLLSAVSESNKLKVTDKEPTDPPVRIVALVGDGTISPLKSATWEEVMLHTAKRLKWVDEGYELLVFTDKFSQCNDQTYGANVRRELQNADILLIVAVTSQETVNWIKTNSKNIQNIICFHAAPELGNKLGGYYVQSKTKGSIFDNIVRISQSNETKEASKVVETVSEAWDRHSSDDIRFCLLVLINAYVKPVPILKNLRSKGFSTLNCMVKNCGPQILNCLLDPNCRKALRCLNQCSPVDQVCNYRCIASYESATLEAFSLCVLQKNNCLELDAKIPEKPYVPPMVKFQGKNLSHETAEDLFVGWLGSLNWSWRVVAGQNPAYDQFPCQYQLFYRGKAKGSFWYEPVFQVRTLEGKMVWRRRKYRVKRGKIPGTFYFSVLDNGVVSNEFWTIVDVSDDLGWGLFHYSGAARVAGQSYTGAVLVSSDGQYPNDMERSGVILALEKCGIKEWELYTVDNSSCINPPLGIPEGSRLHAIIKIKDPDQAPV